MENNIKSSKARFKRRTLHVPNLIIRNGTFVFGSTLLFFDWACRIERQKIDFDSYVVLHMCRT